MLAPLTASIIRRFAAVAGRKRLLVLLPLVAALVGATPAFGAHIEGRLSLRGGGLQLRAPEILRPGVTQVTVTVVDARGSGAGWTLALRSPGVRVRLFGYGCGVESSCKLPQALPSQAVLRAAQNTGLGTIRVVLAVEPVATATPLRFSLSG